MSWWFTRQVTNSLSEQLIYKLFTAYLKLYILVKSLLNSYKLIKKLLAYLKVTNLFKSYKLIWKLQAYLQSTSLPIYKFCNLIEFQQGGSPSPFDRNLATDLAGTAFRWLAEKAGDNLTEDGLVVTGDKDSAVLLGLRKRVKQFLPVQVRLLPLIRNDRSTNWSRAVTQRRAVASDARGSNPAIEKLYNYYLYTVNCTDKNKMMKKRSGIAHLKN